METVAGLRLAQGCVKDVVSRKGVSCMVVVRMLPRSLIPPHKEEHSGTHVCNCSKTARLRDDCSAILINDEYSGAWGKPTANLEVASGRRRSGKTCKSRHGCSSLEQNNGKESNGEE